MSCSNSIIPFLVEVAATKAYQLIPCAAASISFTSHDKYHSVTSRTIPPLLEFIQNLVYATHAIPVSILVSMALLDRLGSKLPPKVSGSSETCHRVFLAALILANKLLYDVPMKNLVWSECSGGLYSVAEINLMEKQFLEFIDFNTNVKEEEIWHQFNLVFHHSQHHWGKLETGILDSNSITRASTPQNNAKTDSFMSDLVDWNRMGISSSLVDNSPTYLNVASMNRNNDDMLIRSSSTDNIDESNSGYYAQFQCFNAQDDTSTYYSVSHDTSFTCAHPQPCYSIMQHTLLSTSQFQSFDPTSQYYQASKSCIDTSTNSIPITITQRNHLYPFIQSHDIKWMPQNSLYA